MSGMGLSFLGPDGCALATVIDEAPGEEAPLIFISLLRIVAGPAHWEKHAERNRQRWIAESTCELCGQLGDPCIHAQCPKRKAA